MAEDYEVEFQAEEAVEVHEAEAVKNLEPFEATPEEIVEVAEVVEEVQAVPEAKPKPTPTSAGKTPKKWSSKSEGGYVVNAPSNIGEVEVVLNALTYQAFSRNSASVRVLQDRLAELGHGSVRRDRQGWLSDGTVEALREFQTEAGLEVTGEADHDTVVAVLKGTKAKVI
jgi:hypothetical protein